MSSSSPAGNPRKNDGKRASGGGRAFGWIVAVVLVAGLGFWLKPSPRVEPAQPPAGGDQSNASAGASAEPAPVTTPAPSPDRLIGGWVRPDGGYLLEIRTVQADGRAQAAYFNPRSINVARAEWKQEAGQLRLLVELRDVNYPGSTYRLALAPDGQQLIGVYHQAVEGQDFEVQFMREK